MCDHAISKSVRQANLGPVTRVEDAEFACEAYASDGVELHRTISRIVDCAECTEMLVAHTFLMRPAVRGVQPTLAQLARTALMFACAALGDEARQELQMRIRAWYINSDPAELAFASDLGRSAGPR